MGLQWEYTARKAYGCGGSVTVSIVVGAEKFHGVKNAKTVFESCKVRLPSLKLSTSATVVNAGVLARKTKRPRLD